MRLIRRIEQIIEGSPAEIAAVHQPEIEAGQQNTSANLAEGSGAVPPAPAVRAVLYGCTSIVCRHRLVAVEALAGQPCPACRHGSLRFDDYCALDVSIARHRAVGR